MRREALVLLLCGWGLYGLLAHTQHSPGYMDAAYYATVGREVAAGHGWQEPFLWQYLDDPGGLPHPAHTYWMPLAALLSALGLWLRPGFWGARLPFLLLAAAIPPLSMLLCWRLTRRRALAWMSGLLALAPPFYLPYLFTTDTFVPCMLLGAAFLLAVAGERWRWLGLLAGLMHLARADGLLWLGLALGLVAWQRRWRDLSWVLGGYLLPMAPWYLRNLAVWGRLTPPGALRALWLLDYNDLFRFPAATLTFARWWAAGPTNWLRARAWALGQNLQTLLAVQGGVVLLPLVVWGAWRLRDRLSVRAGVFVWGLGFALMTFVFPWAGGRGAFFHAGAAVQPLFWGLAAVGLEAFVGWGARRRGWHPPLARRVFGLGLLAITFAVTAATFRARVAHWNDAARRYRALEAHLQVLGAPAGAVVMVNDPPTYAWATGRPAVVVPVGGAEAVRAVALRYGVQYLVLEVAHPPELDAWFTSPATVPGWYYLGAIEGARLFRVAKYRPEEAP